MTTRRPSIGYYVHHVGRGHLHRALVLAEALTDRLDACVTGLSSLPRPDGWPGTWVELARDDDGPAVDPTAGGRLHWAPLGHPGLRSRMATLSSWFDTAEPDAVVVDLSVEVALLARLHGVRVVGVALAGRRDDLAHLLGYDVSDEVVAFWPPGHDALPDLPGVSERVRPLGAVSRLPVADRPPPGRQHVVVLMGAGGGETTERHLASARAETPGWEWTVAGGPGGWREDVRSLLLDADVVVTHGGQNSLAEVAASRRPAVVLPQPRPHGEQQVSADALRRGDWPVVVLDGWPDRGWPDLLPRVSALPGAHWWRWCDGRAPERFADVVREVAAR